MASTISLNQGGRNNRINMQISPRIGMGTISAIINSIRARKHFNRGKKAA
jgi:hypothetical protein